MGLTEEVVRYSMTIDGNVESKAKSTSGAMDKFAAGAKVGLRAAGALSAGILALGSAMISLNNDIASSVDEMNTLAKGSGLSIEAVNGLRLAAGSTGKSLTDLVPKNLAKNLLAVEQGSSGMAKAFRDAGVDALDPLTGSVRDINVVFPELIASLSGMEDGTRAAGIAAQIMGKQGRELLSAFDNRAGFEHFVAQGREFGIKVGPDAVAATNDWLEAQGTLSLAVEHAKQLFQETFGPTTTNILNSFSLGFVFVTSTVAEGVRQMMGNFQDVKAMLDGDLGFGEFTDRLAERGLGWSNAFAKGREEAEKFFKLVVGNGAADEFVGPRLEDGGSSGSGSSGGGPRRSGGGGSGAASPVFFSMFEELMATIGPDIGAVVGEQVKVSNAEAAVVLAEASSQAIIDAADIAAAAQVGAGGGQGMLDGAAAGIAGGPIGLIGGAVTSLVGLVGGLADTLHGLPDMLTGLFSDVSQIVTDIPAVASTLIGETLPGILDALPELISGIVLAAPRLIEAVLEALPELIGSLVQVIPSIVIGVVTSVFDAFTTFFTPQFWLDVGANIGKAVLEALANIGKLLQGKEGNTLGTALGGAAEGERKLFGIHIPKFDGGTPRIKRSGLAFVHEGEEIRTAREVASRRGGGTNGGASFGNVNIYGASNPRQVAAQFQRTLGGYGLNLTLDSYATGS